MQNRLPSPLIILEALLCTFSPLRLHFLYIGPCTEPSVELIYPQILMVQQQYLNGCGNSHLRSTIYRFLKLLMWGYQWRYHKENMLIILKRCYISIFTYEEPQHGEHSIIAEVISEPGFMFRIQSNISKHFVSTYAAVPIWYFMSSSQYSGTQLLSVWRL